MPNEDIPRHRLVEQAEKAEVEEDLEIALALWRALACSFCDERYYCRYGRIAQQLKRWQEAEDAFAMAIAINPSSSLSLEIMGCLWTNRTDKDDAESFKTAEEWFLRAIELERHARTLTLLGAVYAASENYAAAVQAFEEALLLDSRYEEAMYNLAALIKTKNAERAIQLLEDALEIDPNYFLAHEMLGTLYQTKEDLIRAEYHFQRCLEILPTDYWATLYSANLFAVLGRDSKAEQMYESAIALSPELKCGFDFYANFLEFIGKTDQAFHIRKKSTEKEG